jgi:hypothetical protein
MHQMFLTPMSTRPFDLTHQPIIIINRRSLAGKWLKHSLLVEQIRSSARLDLGAAVTLPGDAPPGGLG